MKYTEYKSLMFSSDQHYLVMIYINISSRSVPQWLELFICDVCSSTDYLESSGYVAFPSWCFPAKTKRRTEGIRVPVPLAWGGSSTARVLLRLCPESACQTGPSLELSSHLEAGGCAVGASPGRLGSLAEPQRRGTSPHLGGPQQIFVE